MVLTITLYIYMYVYVYNGCVVVAGDISSRVSYSESKFDVSLPCNKTKRVVITRRPM